MGTVQNLAIVTARKNSKRLPGKNLLELGGKSLLLRSIEFGLSTGFDVLVSTDCDEMRAVSLKAGAKCPWLRPPHLASDFAKSSDVVMHALNWYEKNISQVNLFLLLQPTSPFRDLKYFDQGVSALQSNCSLDGAVSVSPMHHPVHWSFFVDANKLRPAIDDSGLNVRSQDLETSYSLNGSLYLCRAQNFYKKRNFLTDQTSAIVMSEPWLSLDIDTEYDYLIAQYVSDYYNI